MEIPHLCQCLPGLCRNMSFFSQNYMVCVIQPFFVSKVDVRPFHHHINKHGQGQGKPMQVPYLHRFKLAPTATVQDVIEEAISRYFEPIYEDISDAEYFLVDRCGSLITSERRRHLHDFGNLRKKIVGVMIKKTGTGPVCPRCSLR